MKHISRKSQIVIYTLLLFVLFLVNINLTKAYSRSIFSENSELEATLTYPINIGTGESANIELNIRNKLNKTFLIEISDSIEKNNSGFYINCIKKEILPFENVTIKYLEITPITFFSEGKARISGAKIIYNYQDKQKSLILPYTELLVSGKNSNQNINVDVNLCENYQKINIEKATNTQNNLALLMDNSKIELKNFDMLNLIQATHEPTHKEILRKKILESEEIEYIIKDSLAEGFSLSDVEINALNNSCGVFNIQFKNLKGNTKIITGKVENSSVILNSSPNKNNIYSQSFLLIFTVTIVLMVGFLIYFIRKSPKKDYLCNVIDSECEIKETKEEILEELNDLEEKDEIISFVRRHSHILTSKEYKKYIYKNLTKEDIKKIKTILKESLTDSDD